MMKAGSSQIKLYALRGHCVDDPVRIAVSAKPLMPLLRITQALLFG
jgi:hypothetical protein